MLLGRILMSRYLITSAHFIILLISIGILLATFGWYLFLITLLLIPLIILHCYAIYVCFRQYPEAARLILISSGLLFLFSLVRLDSGDSHSYTGLSTLLYAVGFIATDRVESEFYRFGGFSAYILLLIQLTINLYIVVAYHEKHPWTTVDQRYRYAAYFFLIAAGPIWYFYGVVSALIPILLGAYTAFRSIGSKRNAAGLKKRKESLRKICRGKKRRRSA